MPQYSGIWTLGQAAQAIKNQDWTGVPPSTVEYLVVAGGGSGGLAGGGAGGLRQGYAGVTLGSSYTVTVGAGGNAVPGNNSVFGTITSTGGGTGHTGGSGGDNNGGSGGGSYGYSPGSGVSGQGNAGGQFFSGGAGGGGGAGTVGLNAPGGNVGGNGGAGIASDITGNRVVYAGGGGGYGSTSGAPGGVGGGGYGPSASVPGTAGVANTGGGGGGLTGGANITGGSGIVVIRYPGNVQYFTGGTLNYSNGHIVHTFLSSGVLAPTAPRLFASPDYQISRSIRFNSADSAYLNRTPGSASNRTTFTISAWIKFGTFKNDNTIISSGSATAAWSYIDFQSSQSLQMYESNSGVQFNLITTQVFRDPSAWYHIVIAFNTTESVSSNRIKVYVNGVQVTTFSTAIYPTQNYNTYYNSATQHGIGRLFDGSTGYYADSYMTEINFIDGQQLTPASFGYTESSTGVWTPLQYTGSYGANGFYLNFADNSNTTAATLGKDLSGNGNNFTPNNFSVTAGVGNDSLVDSPTNYGVDTGLGGEVRGNYCTLNPLIKPVGTVAYSNGNLVATNSTANWNAIGGTMGITTGKWYWEYISGGQNTFFGIMVPTINFSSGNPQDANAAAGSVLLCDDNKYQIDYNTRVTYTATGHASGAVVGVAVDMDAGTIIFYINGVSQGTITWTSSAAYGKTVIPMAVAYDSGYITTANFGQRAFAYTAPSGFKALCSQNLPESGAGRLPGKYFGIANYTGTGAATPVASGVDKTTYGGLTWFKGRNLNIDSVLIDNVRGYNNYLSSNSTVAEDAYTFVSRTTNTGFDINAASLGVNGSGGYNYVAWDWAAGGTAVTNTAGSITSSVSANPAAGFSIVTYTGNGSNNTVGHGLGVAPSMVIVKNRITAGNSWCTWHTSLTSGAYALFLDATNAQGSFPTIWNSTIPTSTVFSVGTATGTNASANNLVAYCFAEVPGYSRFGSYVGNGAVDGPFVYCGFRPAFILRKCSSTGGDWIIFDVARDTYNVASRRLNSNSNLAEATPGNNIDILSNGWKERATDGYSNASGQTFIFAAFAESPFKYARAR